MAARRAGTESSLTQARGLPAPASRLPPPSRTPVPAQSGRPSLERALRLGHRIGAERVQRAHPAFNDFNFWRPSLDDEPHPLSPEGQKKRLTGLYGKDLGEALLFTDVPEDEALPREKIIAKFLGDAKDDREMRERALNALRSAPADNESLLLHLERLVAPPEDLEVQKASAGPRKGKVLNDGQRCNLPFTDKKQNLPEDFFAPIRKGEVVSVVVDVFQQKGAPDQYQVKPRLGPDDKSEGNLWYIRKLDLEVSKAPELEDFSKVPVFGNEAPSPRDIVQQQLGDCFVLAALGSVAASRPAFITSMIAAPDSEAPAVRFFRRIGGKIPLYEPQWVRVDKKMFVDPKTRQSLYARSEEILWPALIEKAYAVFKEGPHGFMAVDEGGHMSTVFQAILGREAQKESVFDHPLEMGEDHEILVSLLDDGSDRKKLVQFVKQEKLAKKIGALSDPLVVKKIIRAAGLSKKGTLALESYVDRNLSKALGPGVDYSNRDLQLYQKIATRLELGKVIGLGTKVWGEGGTGASGGENVEEVPGLASNHAYTVLDVKEAKDGRRYVRLRNPWGHFGRVYKRDKFLGSTLPGTDKLAPELGTDTALKALESKGAEFWLELSDVVRYFESLYSG